MLVSMGWPLVGAVSHVACTYLFSSLMHHCTWPVIRLAHVVANSMAGPFLLCPDCPYTDVQYAVVDHVTTGRTTIACLRCTWF